MAKRAELTVIERETIFSGKLTGRTLRELAAQVGCSWACARKWWRRGRREGEAGLRRPRSAQAHPGLVGRFDPAVAERARYWKQQHPGRGATRILQDLRDDPALAGLSLPKRTELSDYFHQACPELLRKRRPRAPIAPPRPEQVHALWQLDGREALRLADGTIATTLEVREPIGCVFLASQAHAVQTAKAWRKLTTREIQADLRLVFAQFGLPDGIQTDREPVYGQPATEGFPTLFSLWLVGLGVHHEFSRPAQPTDQPHVERGHRTLTDWLDPVDHIPHLTGLQTGLDHACSLHNTVLPSQAGDCAGRPPSQVHPEVWHPLRPFRPDLELELFRLERVDQFLAQFTWPYRVSTSGQVTILAHSYTLGLAHKGKPVHVRFLPNERTFLFASARDGQELKRCPVQRLDVPTITGLDCPPAPAPGPFQLPLPWQGYALAGLAGVQH